MINNNEQSIGRIEFSIVIPTWNRPALLERALQSVRNAKNDYVVEVIVVDNASNPVACVEGFEDLDITLLRQEENTGPAFARNLGIKTAKYNLVFPLDDDDELTEDAFDIFSSIQAISYLSQFPVIFFACTISKLIKDVEQYDLAAYLERPPQEIKPLINRSVFLGARLAYPNFKIGAEGLLWLHVAQKYNTIVINQVVTKSHNDAHLRLTDVKNQINRASEYMDFQKAMILFLSQQKENYLGFYQKKILGYICYAILAGRKAEMLSFLRQQNEKKKILIIAIFCLIIPSWLGRVILRFYRKINRHGDSF